MFGVDSNRKVSQEKGQWFQLRLLPISSGSSGLAQRFWLCTII